jgi:hypothetical protein
MCGLRNQAKWIPLNKTGLTNRDGMLKKSGVIKMSQVFATLKNVLGH